VNVFDKGKLLLNTKVCRVSESVSSSPLASGTLVAPKSELTGRSNKSLVDHSMMVTLQRTSS